MFDVYYFSFIDEKMQMSDMTIFEEGMMYENEPFGSLTFDSTWVRCYFLEEDLLYVFEGIFDGCFELIQPMIINGLFEINFWDFCDIYNPDESMGDYHKVFWFQEDQFRQFLEMSPKSWVLI